MVFDSFTSVVPIDRRDNLVTMSSVYSYASRMKGRGLWEA